MNLQVKFESLPFLSFYNEDIAYYLSPVERIIILGFPLSVVRPCHLQFYIF